MKKSDKLLVNSYATFLVNPTTLEIVEYNDHGGRYLHAKIKYISDIIEWDDKLSRHIEFENEKKVILSSKFKDDDIEIIVIVQLIEYQNTAFYNIILIDNLEDIRDLKEKTIEQDISSNNLFTNIFEYSPIGLVLVDSDTRLYKANKYMFDCFKLKPREILNERFGNVFGCSTVSESRFLCGEHDGCKDCKLRNGVTKVLTENTNLEGLDLGHDFEINGRTVTKWFTVSASPVQYGNNRYALISFVDITQRVRMEDRLRELGITDPLTKLYNRGHIIKMFEEGLASDKYDDLSVALIDLDNFKAVNDIYGHLVGDEVLILLADILREQLRFSDYVGRYGGEEFLIVFTDTEITTAKAVLERIQKVLKENSVPLLNAPATFSAGLTQVSLKEYGPDDLKDILNQADKQMYKSKAMGKDQVQGTIYHK